MTPDRALALTWPALALAALVAVVYPLLGLRRYRQLERLRDPLPPGLRRRFYRSVIVWQWLLVLASAGVLATGGRGLSAFGQSAGRDLALTLGVTAALVVGFGAISSVTLRQLGRATAEQLPSHARRAGRILPRTGDERSWFVGVAITAGVCEEILYRGYLPWVLWSLTGHAILGYALATLAFALGHAYQGRGGVLVTGILGAFLSAVVWFTQSLVPGQILHAAIDLVNGMALGATMQRFELEEARKAAETLAATAPDAAVPAESPGPGPV